MKACLEVIIKPDPEFMELLRAAVTIMAASKNIIEIEEAPKTAPAPTHKQIRAKLAALSQSGKQAEVKELLKKYGGNKLSDVPEDKYPELLKEAEGI